MRLGTFSLACDEGFIEQAVLQGPNGLRIRYKHIEIDQAIALAKGLSVLVGYNAKQKITFNELRDPGNRMSSLFFDNEYLSIAAVALAFQNEGAVLRSAVQAVVNPTKGHMVRVCFRGKNLYTPVAFEYLWRGVARYNRMEGKSVSTASGGPVEAFIMNYLNTDKDQLKCFLALAEAAGMSPYISQADALKAAESCWLFNPMWRKLNTA